MCYKLTMINVKIESCLVDCHNCDMIFLILPAYNEKHDKMKELIKANFMFYEDFLYLTFLFILFTFIFLTLIIFTFIVIIFHLSLKPKTSNF